MVDEGWLQEALGGVWVDVKAHLFSAAFLAQPAWVEMAFREYLVGLPGVPIMIHLICGYGQ